LFLAVALRYNPLRCSLQQGSVSPAMKESKPCGLFARASTTVVKPDVKVAKKFLISGTVQGVGYRFFAERVANQLGLRGYVKNLWDGRVEAYAIGDAAALEEFKRQLAQGPRGARVRDIEESEQPIESRYRSFVIEGSW
jgi:acylphosphatase